jgi:hypothetical protein
MLIPPNWIFLAAVGLAGIQWPGVWLLGAGVELAYLAWLSTSARFHAILDGDKILERKEQTVQVQDSLLERLTPNDRDCYDALDARCRELLERHQISQDADAVGALASGLSRLRWVFLRLLVSRGPLEELVSDDRILAQADAQAKELETQLADTEPSADKFTTEKRQVLQKKLKDCQLVRQNSLAVQLQTRIAALEERLARTDLSEDLRKSLVGQCEILKQRQAKRQEAGVQLTFVDAELTRITEQVELLREQAMMAHDPRSVSDRVDAITGTLGGANDWIMQQQRFMGQIEDTIQDPPPIQMTPRKKTSVNA